MFMNCASIEQWSLAGCCLDYTQPHHLLRQINNNLRKTRVKIWIRELPHNDSKCILQIIIKKRKMVNGNNLIQGINLLHGKYFLITKTSQLSLLPGSCFMGVHCEGRQPKSGMGQQTLLCNFFLLCGVSASELNMYFRNYWRILSLNCYNF